MRPTNLFTLSTLISLAACAGAPDTIEVRLAPAVISSLDGTTTVSAIVADATTPLDGVAVHIAIDYTDRNGTPHTISPVDGTTLERAMGRAMRVFAEKPAWTTMQTRGMAADVSWRRSACAYASLFHRLAHARDDS